MSGVTGYWEILRCATWVNHKLAFKSTWQTLPAKVEIVSRSCHKIKARQYNQCASWSSLLQHIGLSQKSGGCWASLAQYFAWWGAETNANHQEDTFANSSINSIMVLDHHCLMPISFCWRWLWNSMNHSMRIAVCICQDRVIITKSYLYRGALKGGVSSSSPSTKFPAMYSWSIIFIWDAISRTFMSKFKEKRGVSNWSSSNCT